MALDPEIAQVLAEKETAAPPGESTAGDLRAIHEAETVPYCGTGEAVEEVVEGEIAGVPVRRYRPEDAIPGAQVAYLHGGGWAIGSLDSYDPVCRALANRSSSEVVSVGYRLAPEHPHPAQLEDCLAVTEALDGERIALAGDSAGGYLAVRVGQKHSLGEKVVGQLLVYPVSDPRCTSRSYDTFAEGFGLTREAMLKYWKWFGGPPVEPIPDGPPALVVLADHDVLHDEGEALATALGAELRRYDGTIHGFFRWIARCEVSRRAVADAGRWLQGRLRGSEAEVGREEAPRS